MIRFLLVLLAFVSALLAFMFQETLLFVASGALLLVSVVLVLLQVREQFFRKNRLKLPTELTPDDELKARGVLAVRPKSSRAATSEASTTVSETSASTTGGKKDQDEDSQYAPSEPRESGVSEEELRAFGILDVRPKKSLGSDVIEDKHSAGKETKTPTPVPCRRVDVDGHLPVLQRTLGAHTVCLIDVDTDDYVYRLRSVVSNGAVDDAGTEYPFAGFFLSDLLAETSVLDLGGNGGLDVETMGVVRGPNELKQLVAAPVIREGLPAAFFVAVFETLADDGCVEAVSGAAEFFSSLYALQGDEPFLADSPLASATRKSEPLRLVKSNPRSAQRRIIAEAMKQARGKSTPLALALVCLDSSEEIARSDETTIREVEAWMRDCLEAVTPDGRVEYFGQLGYGILQTRDVTDVEGWVRRAQIVFTRKNGPIDARPVVGVAMLSDQHAGPDDLQADAFKALRAAYECGDSTILVG